MINLGLYLFLFRYNISVIAIFAGTFVVLGQIESALIHNQAIYWYGNIIGIIITILLSYLWYIGTKKQAPKPSTE